MKIDDLKNGVWFRSWSHYRDEPEGGANYIKDLCNGFYIHYSGFGYTEIPYEAIDIKTGDDGEIVDIHTRVKKCLTGYMTTLLLPGDTYESCLDGMLWHLRNKTGLTTEEFDHHTKNADLASLPVVKIHNYETRNWIKYRAAQHIATLTGSPGVDAHYLRGFEDAIIQARLWTVETDPGNEIGVTEEET